MKYILEHGEFIIEATGRLDKKRKDTIDMFFDITKKLYKMFEGNPQIHISNDTFRFDEWLTKNKVKDIAKIKTILYKNFMNYDGNGAHVIYSLKSKELPTRELAEQLANMLIEKRQKAQKLSVKADPKFKGLSEEKQILLALKTIKKEIKQNHGKVFPAKIWNSTSTKYKHKYGSYIVKYLKLYDSYSLSKDAKTLTAIEREFGNKYKKLTNEPEFSKIKHRLYVWLGPEPTIEIANEIVINYIKQRRIDITAYRSKFSDEEKENRNEFQRQQRLKDEEYSRLYNVKYNLKRKGYTDKEIEHYIQNTYLPRSQRPQVGIKEMSPDEHKIYKMIMLLRNKGKTEKEIEDYIKNKYKKQKYNKTLYKEFDTIELNRIKTRIYKLITREKIPESKIYDLMIKKGYNKKILDIMFDKN